VEFKQFCHGEPRNFVNWPVEFDRGCCGKMWALAVRAIWLIGPYIILIGHIMGWASPSVCPFFWYRLWTWKHNVAERPELLWAFNRAGLTTLSIFTSNGQM